MIIVAERVGWEGTSCLPSREGKSLGDSTRLVVTEE